MRPSSLPMLAQCPRFESQASTFADEGTLRHKLLANEIRQACRMKVDDSEREAITAQLDEEDIEGVKWAAQYIQLHAPMSDYPLVVEHRVYPDEDFIPLFSNGGSLDYACGPDIFDFKWRHRDYTLQLAAYALGWMQETGREHVRCHALFGSSKKATVYTFTEASALTAIKPIIAAASDANARPTPCVYCGWCARAWSCPALIAPALEIAAARGGLSGAQLAMLREWLAAGAHTSSLGDPQLVAFLLRTARSNAAFKDGIEHRALTMAEKEGIGIPGYVLKSKRGRQYVTDAPSAFQALALPQPDFLACCEPRLNTSKSYPDKIGVVDSFAKFHGLKKAAAKRDVLARLGPLLKQSKDSTYLKAINEPETEGEE